MHTKESIHSDSPADSESDGASRHGPPNVYQVARTYLAGIALVLALAGGASAFETRLYRDTLVLVALLIVLFLFYRLVSSFRCTRHVRMLTLFGGVAVVLGQVLNTTEEIALLEGLPVLSRDSLWNAFLDGLFGKTGVLALFAALILAVIELSFARDALAVEGDRLAAEVVERKTAQQLLSAHRDHLEEMVAERTAALEASQRALLEKERLAMLGEIMAAVSHEIRNPLGTVRSSLFTVKHGLERADPERLSRALERAERNIIRCDRIIEELLDLSRARDVAPRSTPLDTWLRSVVASAGVPPAVACETDLRSAVSLPLDREKMRRAILNLINNSLQSFEEAAGRERRLHVSSERLDGLCRIRITDTGPGMPPEVLGKLGTPLFSTRAFGVGLGLPVVQETISGHGGQVCYESELGKGTTVTIELPLPANGSGAN